MIGLLCNAMRMFCVSDSLNVLFKFLNPLSLNGNKHLISPYSLTASFSVKLMGMKKIIAKVISYL